MSYILYIKHTLIVTGRLLSYKTHFSSFLFRQHNLNTRSTYWLYLGLFQVRSLTSFFEQPSPVQWSLTSSQCMVLADVSGVCYHSPLSLSVWGLFACSASADSSIPEFMPSRHAEGWVILFPKTHCPACFTAIPALQTAD